MVHDRAGRRRLVAALAVGLALVAALVALQLVDEGHEPGSSSARVRVKGAEASRPASLRGTVDGAIGWRVEVTVKTLDGEARAVADPEGRYRVGGLSPGPAEVSWVGVSPDTATDDISLGSQRAGRTQITLDAGANTFDFSL